VILGGERGVLVFEQAFGNREPEPGASVRVAGG
jgi:hypothetical protein